MKKIIMILFLLTNALLFFNIKEVYEEKDVSDIYNFRNYQPDLVHASLSIDNTNHDIDTQEMLTTFRQLTQDYDITIMRSDFDYYKNQYELHVATQVNIDDQFDLIVEQSLNFNENDENFYTNQKGVSDGVYLYLLNKDINIRIYPMSQMQEIITDGYEFIANSRDELEQVIEIFMDKFGSYVVERNEFENDALDVETEIDSFLPMVISIATICNFLLLIMYIHRNSKKISILRTMGVSLLNIVKQVFLPLFIVIALTIALTNLGLFIIFISSVNERTLPIIQLLFKSGLYQLIGAIITVFVGCFLLTFIPSYSLLKNANVNRYLMNANYVIKLIALIFLLPLLSERLDLLRRDIAVFNNVRNNVVTIADYQVVNKNKPEYQFDGYDIIQYLDEYIKNFDRDIVYSHEPLLAYQEAYNILNEHGAIFCQSNPVFFDNTEIPGITINENFLGNYSIKDNDGKIVNLDNITAEVVYLIPQEYLDEYGVESFQSDPWGNKSELLAIASDQEFFDYSFLWNNEVSTLPYVFTVYQDSAFRLDASIFNNVYFEGDINEILKDTQFYDRIEIIQYQDEMKEISQRYFNFIINHILIMLPSFALILVIIVQYAYLYVKVYQKRIHARILMGHPGFRLFFQLLVESTFVAVSAIVVALYTGLNPNLLYAVIGLDVLVYLVVVIFSKIRQPLVFSNGE